MQTRRSRLLRLFKVLETARSVAEARAGALALEDKRHELRQQDLMNALNQVGLCHVALLGAAARELARLSIERDSLAQEITAENVRRTNADLRSRTAERAIKRMTLALNDLEQRKALEEIAADMVRASASRKGFAGKV